MHGKKLFLLLTSFVVLTLIGCTPTSPLEPVSATPSANQITPGPQNSVETSPTPDHKPTLDMATVEGPLLLIQSGFDEYLFIDPKNQTQRPFVLPISDPRFSLSGNLSPSGQQLFIPQDDHSGVIVNLKTGETIHTYDFNSPALFHPELAVLEALPLVAELNLTEASLIEAVTQAHQESRQRLRWYQSDRYHLSVRDTGKTSTSLFLDDHHTGTRLQLEDQPSLVQDFSVGPDGNQVLLQKGLVFIPGTWQDKSYYLININEQTTRKISLPEGVQNPSLAWFSNDTISIIHQSFMGGGWGFSFMDVETLETKQIFANEFSDLRRFGEYLFVIQRSADSNTTTFELLTLQGEGVAAQTFDQRCFFQYAVSNRLVIQCELESYLMDQTLHLEPFSESILTLSPAPDGQAIIMVNRSEQVFLMEADLDIQSEVSLEESPLEIRWLPDSTGFVYRTHGKLFFYDLDERTSHLLLESDLFSDYTNINAVWVNLE